MCTVEYAYCTDHNERLRLQDTDSSEQLRKSRVSTVMMLSIVAEASSMSTRLAALVSSVSRTRSQRPRDAARDAGKRRGGVVDARPSSII